MLDRVTVCPVNNCAKLYDYYILSQNIHNIDVKMSANILTEGERECENREVF